MKATAPTPMTAPVLTVSLLALLVAAACGGAEWPRFRGPDGAGIAAADATPATTWSETSHLQWKAALPGAGSSSPIVAGGRIFVSCYSGYGVDGGEGGQDQLVRHLVCLARDSGKILWDSAVPAELPEDPYAGFLREHGYVPSPVVCHGHLFFVSDQGFATCMEAKTGKVVYKERLPGLRGSKPFYASVVLANDRLYAASRRAGTYVLAAAPKFALLAHNTLAGDDSDFNGTPAVVGRQLFLRSNRFLYCIDAGAGGRSE